MATRTTFSARLISDASALSAMIVHGTAKPEAILPDI
jgi:hypothetical protein